MLIIVEFTSYILWNERIFYYSESEYFTIPNIYVQCEQGPKETWSSGASYRSQFGKNRTVLFLKILY